MGGKLNVYNLGEKGVNVTKTPLHHEDGELASAQNAEFYAEAGLGGLRKRPGLLPLNGSALTGAVAGVIGVPLAGPRRALYLATDVGQSPPWYKTTDVGVTVVDSDEQRFTIEDMGDNDNSPTLSFGGRLFYGTIQSPQKPVLACFDGAVEYEVSSWPAAVSGGNLRPIFMHQDKLYVGLSKGSHAACTLYEVDLFSGEQRRIANDLDTSLDELYSGCSYMGQLWVGMRMNLDDAKLYAARPNDTAWVLKNTAPANHNGYAGLAPYAGDLYMGTVAEAGTSAIVQKMTSTGTVTTSQTGSGSSAGNRYDGLVVFQNELYAFYVAANTCQAEKWNGTAWSVDKDFFIAAGRSYNFGSALITGSTLWVVTKGDTGKGAFWKKTGGVWSQLVSGNDKVGSGGIVGII